MIIVQELVKTRPEKPENIHNYVCMQQDMYYNVWDENFYLDEFSKHGCVPLNSEKYNLPPNVSYKYLLTPHGPPIESRLWFFIYKKEDKYRMYWMDESPSKQITSWNPYQSD